jgi:glycosyltransferase involved in cell wall biosynthesis
MSKKISILTPTYDRRKFLPIMIENIMSQTYPKHLIEWVICDSYSVEGVEAEPLFIHDKLLDQTRDLLAVEMNYKYFHKAMTIGEKRNWMVKNAKYDVLICMDSDDIYLPTYLQYSLDMLLKNKVGLCGSPQMLFIYPNHDYKTSFINCPSNRQIHEATMCFTRKHFRRMWRIYKNG